MSTDTNTELSPMQNVIVALYYVLRTLREIDPSSITSLEKIDARLLFEALDDELPSFKGICIFEALEEKFSKQKGNKQQHGHSVWLEAMKTFIGIK